MKKAIRISEAEWEVMSIVWKSSPTSASAIADALHESKQWSLATVRTLLTRLVRKGALVQTEDGKRYLYQPTISMEECARRESESFWDRVLGRAPTSALVHLVKKADLSPEDIKELRKVLREKEK
jgi:BlaI family penicillinase repressor